MSGAPAIGSRPSALTLYLVRHGVAEGAEGRCVGHADLPLSGRGRADVVRLARAWPDPPPRRVVTSDLARARATAAALCETWALGHAARPPVATDGRLREMHFGRWDGRTWADLERDDGPALGRWMADWQDAAAPGGESFGDVIARAAAWLGDEARAAAAGRARAGGAIAAADDGRRVVVLHAGSIRALLVHALGLPRAAAFRLRVDHARVTVLRVPLPAAEGDGGCAELGELACLNAERAPAVAG